jgi:hypothetical protein
VYNLFQRKENDELGNSFSVIKIIKAILEWLKCTWRLALERCVGNAVKY